MIILGQKEVSVVTPGSVADYAAHLAVSILMKHGLIPSQEEISKVRQKAIEDLQQGLLLRASDEYRNTRHQAGIMQILKSEKNEKHK